MAVNALGDADDDQDINSDEEKLINNSDRIVQLFLFPQCCRSRAR